MFIRSICARLAHGALGAALILAVGGPIVVTAGADDIGWNSVQASTNDIGWNGIQA
jgi:hypothetical protein